MSVQNVCPQAVLRKNVKLPMMIKVYAEMLLILSDQESAVHSMHIAAPSFQSRNHRLTKPRNIASLTRILPLCDAFWYDVGGAP